MGLNRRAFIQFAVGGGIGSMFTPMLWKLTDDVSIWTQNWHWIPRVPGGAQESVPALSKLLPSGSAIQVCTVGGKPYATKGDPDSPLSGGGIDALSAAAVPLMRSPTRVAGPMKKSGEGYEALTWEDATILLTEQLKAAGSSVAAISGDETGTANDVLSAFVAGLGGDYYMMPSAQTAAAKAYNQMMGGSGQVGYDLDGADLVLAAGADILESWGPTVAYSRAFRDSHPINEKATATYVYAGPVQNRTAAVSDKWVPVKADAMADFLLGVAYNLITSGKSISSGGFGALKGLLASKYTPDKVAAATGLSKDDIKGVADMLAEANSPVVVADYGLSPAVAAAGIVVNLLLGAENSGLVALRDVEPAVDGALTRVERMEKDLVADLAGGKYAPKVSLIFEANPYFALPQAGQMAEALGKAGFTVAFSTFMDETAAQADLVLPNAFCLERFDDVVNPFGIGTAMHVTGAPVAKPAVDAKSIPDFLLELAENMGSGLGFDSFEEVIGAKDELAGSGPSREYILDLDMPVDAFAAAKGGGTVALAAELLLNAGTPTLACPPHNAATIPATVIKGSDMFVHMNMSTAQGLGLAEGDMVKLTAAGGEVKAMVHVTETVASNTVAGFLGFGHTAWDEFSKGKGDNLLKVLPHSAGSGWAGAAVDIAKI